MLFDSTDNAIYTATYSLFCILYNFFVLNIIQIHKLGIDKNL